MEEKEIEEIRKRKLDHEGDEGRVIRKPKVEAREIKEESKVNDLKDNEDDNDDNCWRYLTSEESWMAENPNPVHLEWTKLQQGNRPACYCNTTRMKNY